jgi:NADH-ubiquinone oxidoreductase chain 4
MWGYQPERLQASMYLIIYTITASLPLLMGLVFLLHINESIIFLNPPTPHLTNHFHNLTLITAFLIKIPIYPLHL